MPVTALLGTEPTRSMTVRSTVSAAQREFDRGNWVRGLLLLGLLVLVRMVSVVDLPARGTGSWRRGE
ncbi:hypothetical protein [Natrinema halophilum]|uniref:Uncharacterized protein n=1 Tax=Natrinema halophilum TaxID=1699371 RepID=A0A7D5H912_9EURY|nr:hypothetical protein [Natrinema halophilum]QLG49935.1 hypothetical protein HYG82_14265 [Natrinema halophilum]